MVEISEDVFASDLGAAAEHQDVVGGSTGTILIPEVADQSFFAPESWAQQFTSRHNWDRNNPRMLADVNGDGKQDIVGFGDDGVWLATSTGTGFGAPQLVLADLGNAAGGWLVDRHPRLMADVNGDGKQDIVGFGDDGVWLATSTGTGFGAPQLVLADLGYAAGGWLVDRHPRLMADVNGDGKQDIVGFGNSGVYVSLSTGTGFSTPTFVVADFGYDQGWRVDKHIRTTADVNGDGKQDIVGFGDDGVWLATSTGTGFGAPQLVLADLGYAAGGWLLDRHPRLMADINGDSKQDIVGFGNSGVYVSLSTGTGFSTPTFVVADFGYDQGWRVGIHPGFVADLNGDGYQDIVGFGNDFVYRSLGSPGRFSGFRGVLRDLVPGRGDPWNLRNPDLFPRFVGDVNGDGMQDLVAFDRADIKVARSSNLPPLPPPRAPSNPRVTNSTSTSLSIAWDDNSNDEDGFIIGYWKKEDGSTNKKVITVGANVKTRVLSSLDSETGVLFQRPGGEPLGILPNSGYVCGRTKVKQVTPPPPTETGFSSVNVFNCHSDGRPLNIWTRDITQSTWVLRGTAPALWSGGSCPGSAAPFVVPLQDGHYFWFVAVDPQLIGCDGQNNPEYSACQRSVYTSPLKGNANGPALRNLIS